jgi:hypothetical protein
MPRADEPCDLHIVGIMLGSKIRLPNLAKCLQLVVKAG